VFSHVFTGVSDFDRAYAFYSQIMQVLEIALRFHDPSKPRAAWQSAGGTRPLFMIGMPDNGQSHDPGNGQMVAFLAGSRKKVQSAHELAISLGAKCEGPPGLRPQYHENYFGAYFRDPDGNKVCVACHEPEA
jgi:catechol 2,3-dioxygenase-like lactoylglutathione lyase family enzyme